MINKSGLYHSCTKCDYRITERKAIVYNAMMGECVGFYCPSCGYFDKAIGREKGLKPWIKNT